MIKCFLHEVQKYQRSNEKTIRPSFGRYTAGGGRGRARAFLSEKHENGTGSILLFLFNKHRAYLDSPYNWLHSNYRASRTINRKITRSRHRELLYRFSLGENNGIPRVDDPSSIPQV